MGHVSHLKLPHLIHDTLLSITISILEWIDLLEKRWLGSVGGVSGIVVVVEVAGTVCGGGSRRSTIHSRTNSAIVQTLGNVLWFTLESLGTIVDTVKSTTLLLEFIHAYSWKSRGSVVLWLIVVNLVHGNSGVHNGWLDSLLLNDRLDGLVDMVMMMLTGNGWCNGMSLFCCGNLTLILELSYLGGDLVMDALVISMVMLSVLSSSNVVMVLSWKDLLILDWENRCVVVFLVNLVVHDSSVYMLTSCFTCSCVTAGL